MNKHTDHSSFREKLIEHLFVGELLKLSWQRGECDLEVAKPEVDNSGYDLIAEANKVVRHIQLKASYKGGKTTTQKIHKKLAEKPSGCVVWIYFDSETLVLGPFYYFGGMPGEQLPAIDKSKDVKHTRGNRYGQKAERPNIRKLNKGSFRRCDTIADIHSALFGASGQKSVIPEEPLRSSKKE